ncbi:MAG: methylated-DNA--[protein]-cysteine S-methyltransferase [Longibaculum muris]|uniref:Methylated-DNA-protein-cysteine methyltransferase-like protein n=1 Tax=Longibaculum muris TaxID=1796628 RepID=A0A4R3YHH6_9FIRM|nr:methylated-DNA--[protein]-cysteine S-methyltransferase [Longibaculum muris]KXU46051.1 6-O-methylguanine DNA methyltransferase, DNA binding domain protein [Candidatus Stoquefichus sp. KLE1796]MBS5370221.1 methylated-DNA--[protein]-cysteine S-methyltransferase [Coprobacillus cateniformis]MCR1889195.1 methylated-DNA--[protein]-cysteine S-methyltransferase [Longibaculum muris]MED9810516.1 methylated-DNA--[protein]-cysteine S-methyltransferase [Longibaculum muris]TCV91767.1 methylated-DNA-protei
MATLNDEFLYQVFAIVEEIPLGTVATYGQIARLSGHDKNARLVGKALSLSEYFGKYPCHRVVSSQGRCAPGWFEQKDLLTQEGITFKENGCVDLKKHQWKM